MSLSHTGRLFVHTSAPLIDCEKSFLETSTCLVRNEHTVNICQKEVWGQESKSDASDSQSHTLPATLPCLVHSFTYSGSRYPTAATCLALQGTSQRQRPAGPSLALKQHRLVKGGKAEQDGKQMPPTTPSKASQDGFPMSIFLGQTPSQPKLHISNQHLWSTYYCMLMSSNHPWLGEEWAV